MSLKARQPSCLEQDKGRKTENRTKKKQENRTKKDEIWLYKDIV